MARRCRPAYGWETEVVVDQGGTLTMPATVTAVRNDGRMATVPRTIERQPVTWDADDVAAVDVTTPGEYVVLGSVGDGTDNAFAHVVVRAPAGAAAAAPALTVRFDGATTASYAGRLDHMVHEAQAARTPYESPRVLTEELLAGNGAPPGRLRSFVATLDAARAAEERGAETAWQRQLATFEMKIGAATGRLLTSPRPTNCCAGSTPAVAGTGGGR